MGVRTHHTSTTTARKDIAATSSTGHWSSKSHAERRSDVAMLLSRKRARDAHGGVPSTSHESWLLRDLVAASRGSHVNVLDLLRRLQPQRNASVDGDSLELSQAHLSSQELFLSAVLEWQRATEPTREHAFHSIKDDNPYPSSASSASSDDERDEQPRLQDVSPTSVHNVPGALLPLKLDAINSPSKKIGVYTPRSRQELLQKYMTKRARRLSQNKVRYGVRKTLANARPRVKGRFVKTEQPLTAAIASAIKSDKTDEL